MAANSKKYFYQRGVSLLMTFFIMVVALSIIVSISPFIYNQIQLEKNLGDANASYYAAYSGVEKVLYYDHHMAQGSRRGVCRTYPYNTATNPGGCLDSSVDKGFAIDNSLYCDNQAAPEILDVLNNPHGCDPLVCNSCKIAFTSAFDAIKYSVETSVLLGQDGLPVVTIDARGMSGSSSREIKLLDAGALK